jgi:uncharacterized protein (TIGR02594 family)
VELGREDLARKVEALLQADARPEAVREGLARLYRQGDLDHRDLTVVESLLEGMSAPGAALAPLETTASARRLSDDAGRPLPTGVRERLEGVFQRDLSSIRVHDGEAGAEVAAGYGAQALASGRDIYVGVGQSAGDAALMGHEVAHSVQGLAAVGLQASELPTDSSSQDVTYNPTTAKATAPGKSPSARDRIAARIESIRGLMKSADTDLLKLFCQRAIDALEKAAKALEKDANNGSKEPSSSSSTPSQVGSSANPHESSSSAPKNTGDSTEKKETAPSETGAEIDPQEVEKRADAVHASVEDAFHAYQRLQDAMREFDRIQNEIAENHQEILQTLLTLGLNKAFKALAKYVYPEELTRGAVTAGVGGGKLAVKEAVDGKHDWGGSAVLAGDLAGDLAGMKSLAGLSGALKLVGRASGILSAALFAVDMALGAKKDNALVKQLTQSGENVSTYTKAFVLTLQATTDRIGELNAAVSPKAEDEKNAGEGPALDDAAGAEPSLQAPPPPSGEVQSVKADHKAQSKGAEPNPPPPDNKTPMDYAEEEQTAGVEELLGKDKNNPRIVDYHQSTTLKANDDETAWCSSFVNWALRKAGYPTNASAHALDWANFDRFPVVTDDPQRGDIVVFVAGSEIPTTNKETGRYYVKGIPGHVGFLSSVTRDSNGALKSIKVLGGNQGGNPKKGIPAKVNTISLDVVSEKMTLVIIRRPVL